MDGITQKILVVDDEPDLGGLISQKYRARIRSGELSFRFAENGAVALDILGEDPGISVVFTDINMPVMDGLTFLGKKKELAYQQKAVVISAFGDMTNIRTAMNRGAFDFITKPIDFTDLDATLEKAIAEMRVFREGEEAKINLEAAQQEALRHLQEKEKLILEQNERLERLVVERTRELARQKDLVEVKNTEILDSIRYARRLQEAILPPPSSIRSFFPQSFVLYLPKDIVSGDFYWMTRTDDGILVVAADCTGHGVSGALMSMLGTSLLNHIVVDNGITRPAVVLDQLHRAVVSSLKQDENSTNEGMDMAVCLFPPTGGELQYAGANRPLWIFGETGVRITPPDKLPIGGIQLQRQPYANHAVPLQPGDVVYLFTDGYADQFGGDLNKKLMTKRFREMIGDIRSLPLNAQHDELLARFEAWKGDREQLDDVLVIGLAP